jgi:hypothetical protein
VSFTLLGLTSSLPEDCLLGPDGNVWVLDNNMANPGVWRVIPSTLATSFFGFSGVDASAASNSFVSDGTSLWAGNQHEVSSTFSFLKVTMAGVVSLIPWTSSPPSGDGPNQNLTYGPDGNFWLRGDTQVYKVTPAGVITAYTFPPAAIAGGGLIGASCTDGTFMYYHSQSVSPNREWVTKMTTGGVVQASWPVQLTGATPNQGVPIVHGGLLFTASGDNIVTTDTTSRAVTLYTAPAIVGSQTGVSRHAIFDGTDVVFPESGVTVPGVVFCPPGAPASAAYVTIPTAHTTLQGMAYDPITATHWTAGTGDAGVWHEPIATGFEQIVMIA